MADEFSPKRTLSKENHITLFSLQSRELRYELWNESSRRWNPHVSMQASISHKQISECLLNSLWTSHQHRQSLFQERALSNSRNFAYDGKLRYVNIMSLVFQDHRDSSCSACTVKFIKDDSTSPLHTHTHVGQKFIVLLIATNFSILRRYVG